MDTDASATAPAPNTLEAYEYEDDMADCEIVCAGGAKIHDLVEIANCLGRKVPLMKHLEKHGLLDSHRIAGTFYSKVQ